jgi:cytoskeleton protein RodZ
MNDAQTAAGSPASSPGALLRQAREGRGLTVQALSQATKVSATRLEALEADRWETLPDLAYVRNLAHTVCRALEVDPAPVLAGLPAAARHALERVDEGLHAPFREPVERSRTGLSRRTVVTAISIAIVLAALAAAWGTGALAGLVRAWNGGASAARGGVGTLAANPAASSAQTAAAEAGRAAGGDSLRLVASAETWVEILDGDGRAVLSRTLLAGEALELDAALPLRLTLGNARATEVLLRGQAIDLLPHTRENVARLELR